MARRILRGDNTSHWMRIEWELLLNRGASYGDREPVHHTSKSSICSGAHGREKSNMEDKLTMDTTFSSWDRERTF